MLAVFGRFYPRTDHLAAVVLSLREKEFIEVARMTGSSDWRIIRLHILPHLIAPHHGCHSTSGGSASSSAEAGSPFLGVGIKQPTADWGNLLQEGPELLHGRSGG